MQICLLPVRGQEFGNGDTLHIGGPEFESLAVGLRLTRVHSNVRHDLNVVIFFDTFAHHSLKIIDLTASRLFCHPSHHHSVVLKS